MFCVQISPSKVMVKSLSIIQNARLALLREDTRDFHMLAKYKTTSQQSVSADARRYVQNEFPTMSSPGFVICFSCEVLEVGSLAPPRRPHAAVYKPVAQTHSHLSRRPELSATVLNIRNGPFKSSSNAILSTRTPSQCQDEDECRAGAYKTQEPRVLFMLRGYTH